MAFQISYLSFIRASKYENICALDVYTASLYGAILYNKQVGATPQPERFLVLYLSCMSSY